ncbi:unnamed protein product [Nezara viridula]|uniref:Uncharacterized protein n=1 Tax=Nezara viridula TaxID=85310 RepID=A0A9P0HFP9_NEZVI|nr:unnamed protein product [Nezara viridula]
MMKAAQQGGGGGGGGAGGGHMLGNPPHTPGLQGGPSSPQPPGSILGALKYLFSITPRHIQRESVKSKNRLESAGLNAWPVRRSLSSGSQHSPGGYLGGHVGGTPTPSSTPVSDMSPQPGHGGSPPGPWEMKPPPHHHPHHHPPAPPYMPQYSWYQAAEPNPGLLT